MYLKFFILIICFFISFSTTCREYDIYEVDQGDTLQEIAQQRFEKYSFRYSSVDDYIEDIKQWNLHVKNWGKLMEGTELYLNYPFPIYFSFPYTPPLKYVAP